MHAFMHTYIHTHMHTCIHAYIHTYICKRKEKKRSKQGQSQNKQNIIKTKAQSVTTHPISRWTTQSLHTWLQQGCYRGFFTHTHARTLSLPGFLCHSFLAIILAQVHAIATPGARALCFYWSCFLCVAASLLTTSPCVCPK